MPGKNNKRIAAAEQDQKDGNRKLNTEEQRVGRESFREAEKDMQEDPDLSAGNPNDNLDEGESARLGDDKTGLV